MRDEHYSPFKGSSPLDPLRLEAVTVFMMARLRGAQTASKIMVLTGGCTRR